MGLAGNLLAGRYRLDEPIGRGGFSEVWRATDAVLARPVAVKLLHPGCAQQADVLARFRAEAQNAAALWHVNIAHVFDYDESADGLQPYLVMELVDGPCLAGAIAGGPLSAEWTMDIVAQVAAGLQAAHAIGLIHRDIKPGNLLLASDGIVKITDFGISRTIGSVPVTVTGVVMGTAGYLAPERIAGAQAGPASDLYALGVVAYECLAGAPPFTGEPLDVACAHRERPVPPLRASVPAGVNALVMQLVAKDPAWRPGSAEVAHKAGRLRDDLRDRCSDDADRTRNPLAAPAAVPPPTPAIARAAFAPDTRRPVPAAPLAAPRARTGARQRRRRPVRVLASAAIAGIITTVLAVTVGAALIQHPLGALPSAPPRHPASGTAAAPPARQPTSASPSRQARHRTSPGDTRTLQMDASNHQTITAPKSARETIRRHRHGNDANQVQGQGQGYGHGHGDSHGNGNGNGHGQANGNGNGQGNGNGHGQGQGQGRGNGNGNGHGQRTGNGNAPVLSVLNQPPGRSSTDGTGLSCCSLAAARKAVHRRRGGRARPHTNRLESSHRAKSRRDEAM